VLIDETKKSMKPYPVVDTVTFPVTDKGAIIGKLKKH